MLGTSVGKQGSAWKGYDQQVHMCMYIPGGKALVTFQGGHPLTGP